MKNLSRLAVFLVFTFSSGIVAGQSHGWIVNEADYEYSGEVNAIVTLGATEVTKGTLGAFVNDICRGFADCKRFHPTGKYVFTVLCHSNPPAGEIITFRYFNPANSTTYNVTETVTFAPEMVLGDALNPLSFHAPVNIAPVLDPIGNKTICQLSELAFTATATDPDADDILTFSLVGAPAGASINSTSGAFSWTPNGTQSGSYTFKVKVSDDATPALSDEEEITVTVNAFPSAAGPITGPATFTPGTAGISYSVSSIANATSYVWSYTGTGATINGNGSRNITIDFSASATGGQLKVKGSNTCGDGAESSIILAPSTKSLNITLLLEGLYNGAAGLVKAADCTDGENPFDKFTGTISDTLTIQIAQTTNPYNILFSAHGVAINTNGTVSLSNIPGTLSGSNYIIIKHRNHIETWSQIVSFAGQTISYNFTNAASKAWGNNLVLTGSFYSIYTGDTNKDQYVDGFDMAKTFNLNKQGSFGYQLSDINGDGFIDGFDLAKVFNNTKKGVGINTPPNPLEKK